MESFGTTVLVLALSHSGVAEQPGLYGGWTTGKSLHFTINKAGCLWHCNQTLFPPDHFPKIGLKRIKHPPPQGKPQLLFPDINPRQFGTSSSNLFFS